MKVAGYLGELRRAVGWHRRLLAAGLAAASVALAINALAPPAPATVEVFTAARDLRPGVVLTGADLASARLPPGATPSGVLRPGAQVAGRVLASAVRRGEALTDVRLVGRPLLAALGAEGLIAAPVRIADAASAGLLQPGDLVDVIRAGPPAGLASEGFATGPPADAAVVAAGVTVLTVLGDEPTGIGGEGALVLLAVPPGTAIALARAAATGRLSYALRPR